MTLSAIKAPFLSYVENDVTLSEKDKEARRLLIASWERRVEEARKSAGVSK